MQCFIICGKHTRSLGIAEKNCSSIGQGFSWDAHLDQTHSVFSKVLLACYSLKLCNKFEFASFSGCRNT